MSAASIAAVPSSQPHLFFWRVRKFIMVIACERASFQSGSMERRNSTKRTLD
jgi:hypothetical protein